MAGISSKLSVLTNKAKVIIAVAVIFFVVLGGMIVAMVLIQSSNDTVQEDFSKSDAKTRQDDAVGLAEQALESGNTTRADNVYKKAIDAEPDSGKKVQLAIDYSRMLRGQGRMADSIEVAKRAEGYQDDKHAISVWLGALYEGDKQYDKAIEYYTIAADTVDSPANLGFSKIFYEDRIAAIKQVAAKK